MSTALGIRLTLLAGPTVPVPAPDFVLEAIESIEVAHSDETQSGFQMVFRAGRGATAFVDYPLASSPQLKAGARVVIVVTLGVVPQVLIDGVIQATELAPGDGPGAATLTVRGKDLSAVMDQEEKSVEHVGQPEAAIVAKIIASYAGYGLIPVVIPPVVLDVPLPIDRVPMQQGTDLAYLNDLAKRADYVFTVTPGPAPATSTAYWGPPPRLGVPQRALTVNMGPETNVANLSIQNDAAAAAQVEGEVQDRLTNESMTVRSVVPLRPPLALQPAIADAAVAGKRQYRAEGARSAAQAFAEAQAASDATTDVVSVTGDLDTGSYGGLLKARGLVGLRGAGLAHDGLYYVKEVTHKISPGDYTQSFNLVREGLGATIPAVLP